MNNTEEQMLETLDRISALGNEIKMLQEEQKVLKQQVSDQLEKQGMNELTLGSFVAKQVTRKGSVKVNMLQARYNISDEELDEHYRNQPSIFWTFKEVQ